MARDNRIERAKRDPHPSNTERDLTTSDRVQLLVADVLNRVCVQIEEKHAQEPASSKR
ncbi:hypothetical protein KUV51_09675 [Tateyamaria omphalii]|uniref:hypothetical protein n=1 Tax=Tateyamaria omphalii TaxID=299262 RepID=UPI001C9A0093|nr:hypothetical protein [Tateyamaria omphalii]MBY5933265.1 hypothetical protein [Tateyamaria omphalii]